MLLHARLLSAQSYLDTTGNVCRTAVMTPLQCTPINYTRTLGWIDLCLFKAYQLKSLCAGFIYVGLKSMPNFFFVF